MKVFAGTNSDKDISKFTPTIVSKQFTEIFATGVVTIGLLVLIGWFSKLMFLTRFSVNEVPMAPSTAYVFIFLAIGLWLYVRPQKTAINRNLSIASAVTAICLPLFLAIANILKYNTHWEHIFIKMPETQLNMQIGHMSLVTELLFIISGFALLFLQSNRKIVKTFSIGLTLIIFIFSFLLLLGYGFGTPFFYFDNFIPPAALTVLSFLLVSLGLITASNKNTFIVKSIWKTSTSAKLLRIFLPTTIAITVVESLIIIRVLPALNIHPAIAITLVTLIFVVAIIVVISIISKSLGKSLDKALKNLSESEERFRTISENAPVLINSFSEDGKCLFWNKQCKNTFGWTKEEINEHENVMSLFYPDPDVCEEVIRTVTSDPDGNFREWHPVTKDGKKLSTMWANFSLPNGQVFSMGYDITERKMAEQELKESEAQLRLITDNLPIIISQIDKDFKYLFVNKFYYDRSKFSENIIGKNVIDVIGEETFERGLPYMQKALSGESVSFLNRSTHTKNNKLIIFETTYIPYIVNGKVESFFVLGMDITERKQAEEAFLESEGKLKALFTSLIEMVVMHEVVLNDAGEAIDYRILDCNKVFTEITGISKKDAVGKLASEVYQSNPPPFLEKYAKVAQGGDPLEFTTFYPPLDKHLMISVVSPQPGKFATITTDISDMMQIQEAIMAKNKEMENYLYIASHDLRTPLVNIQGFSQRLKKQTDSIKNLLTDKTVEQEVFNQLSSITDENIPRTLNFILGNIEKMDTLINGLLQLSRTGRLEMNIQRIDMNTLFAEIFQSLDFQIKEAHCKIHINPLPYCYGDATLLNQLFANLISNALKYSDSERALEITIDAKKTYNKVIYSIKDTGKGIAKKHLEKIWDIFYRIDPRSEKTGEGIGLSLAKRITEKHKGKIWVESEENKGSVFHIELKNFKFTEL